MKTFRHEIRTIALWSVASLLVFASGVWFFGVWHDEWSGYNAHTKISDGTCNIAIVPIIGEISVTEKEDTAFTSADKTLSLLSTAEKDSKIKGILVRIDSPGGSGVASEIIANALKRSSLTVASLIREVGASGGYWIATGADTIIASPLSDIGSIGVTMSYLDNTQKNAKDGIKYVSLASAKFKDYGNPDKPLNQAERTLFERDLKIHHEQFVKEVAENRGLPIEQIAKLADGSVMPGTLALQNKLIDALGDQETTRAWFAEKLEIAPEDVVFCE